MEDQRENTQKRAVKGAALWKRCRFFRSLKNSARSCQALQFCSLQPWTTTRDKGGSTERPDKRSTSTWTELGCSPEPQGQRSLRTEMWMFLSDGLTERWEGGGAEAHPPPSTLWVGSRLTQWAHSSVGFCWTLTFWGAWMPATHDTHSPKTDTHTVAAQIYPFHHVIRKWTKDFTLGYTRLKSAFGKFPIVNKALFSAAHGVHRVWLHRVWHHVLHSLRSSSAETDKQNKEEKMADGAGSLDILLVVLSCAVPHKPFRLRAFWMIFMYRLSNNGWNLVLKWLRTTLKSV